MRLNNLCSPWNQQQQINFSFLIDNNTAKLIDFTIQAGTDPKFSSGGQKDIELNLNSLSDLNPLTNWVLDKKNNALTYTFQRSDL